MLKTILWSVFTVTLVWFCLLFIEVSSEFNKMYKEEYVSKVKRYWIIDSVILMLSLIWIYLIR